MKKYELMFVVSENFSEPKASEISKEISSQVAKIGGAVEKEIFWGKKKLAYKIANSSFGYYFMVIFSAEGGILEKLTKELNLNDKIIRYLVTEYLEGVELPDTEKKAAFQKDESGRLTKGAKRTGMEEIAKPVETVKAKKEKAPIVEMNEQEGKIEENNVVKEEETQKSAEEKEAKEIIQEEMAEAKEGIESKEPLRKIEEETEERKVVTEEERKIELEKRLAEILGDDASVDL